MGNEHGVRGMCERVVSTGDGCKGNGIPGELVSEVWKGGSGGVGTMAAGSGQTSSSSRVHGVSQAHQPF